MIHWLNKENRFFIKIIDFLIASYFTLPVMSELLSVSSPPSAFFNFYVIKLNISVFYSKTMKYFWPTGTCRLTSNQIHFCSWFFPLLLGSFWVWLGWLYTEGGGASLTGSIKGELQGLQTPRSIIIIKKQICRTASSCSRASPRKDNRKRSGRAA